MFREFLNLYMIIKLRFNFTNVSVRSNVCILKVMRYFGPLSTQNAGFHVTGKTNQINN